MDKRRGFTLIEMMLVIAIIAILAAIVLPTYQNYVARSQLTAALSDIAGGKGAFEAELLAENVTSTDPTRIGLRASTERCSSIETDSSTNGFIRCTVRGNPQVNGRTLTLMRSSTAQSWRCSSSVTNKHLLPSGCQ